MKLYLIRHGESANNVIFSSTGDESDRVPDPELTERGHQQAELLAKLLADPQIEPHHHPHDSRAPGNGNGSHAMGFGLTHVYCSLMTRFNPVRSSLELTLTAKLSPESSSIHLA